jgi:hypothetical protein
MDLNDQHEVSSDKDTDIESLPEITNFKPVCGMTKGNQTVWNLSQVNVAFLFQKTNLKQHDFCQI